MILFLILNSLGFSAEAPSGPFQQLVECATQAGPGETPYVSFITAHGSQPKTVIVNNAIGANKDVQGFYAIQSNRAYFCQPIHGAKLNSQMKIKLSFDGADSTDIVDAQLISSGKLTITHESLNIKASEIKGDCKTNLDLNEQLPNLVREIKAGIDMVGEAELSQMMEQKKVLTGLNFRKTTSLSGGDNPKSDASLNVGASQTQHDREDKFSKSIELAINRLKNCASIQPPSNATALTRSTIDDLQKTIKPQLDAMNKMYSDSQAIVNKTILPPDAPLDGGSSTR